jgi:hypothetical protein
VLLDASKTYVIKSIFIDVTENSNNVSRAKWKLSLQRWSAVRNHPASQGSSSEQALWISRRIWCNLYSLSPAKKLMVALSVPSLLESL